MTVTMNKIDGLLKGYRREYPLLAAMMEEELAKQCPSRAICEGLQRELDLYSVLMGTVMKLNSKLKPAILHQYFSATPVTYDDTAEYLEIDRSTVSRRLAEGKRRLLAMMNTELARKGAKHDEADHKASPLL